MEQAQQDLDSSIRDGDSMIATSYLPKPIPWRSWDWEAWEKDNEDEDSPVGFGSSKAEAIANLQEQL